MKLKERNGLIAQTDPVGGGHRIPFATVKMG